MTDRRVNRTKRQIKKALINLLSKKALSRITVSEITELADIGRGTFYTHYQDIYDLYHSLINELAKDVHTGYVGKHRFKIVGFPTFFYTCFILNLEEFI